MNLTDSTTIFAIVFAFIALSLAFGAIAFALWYGGDQTEL